MGIIGEILQFLWMAILHWAVWVTGTGIVGFCLWGFNQWERHRGEHVKPRTYLLILFCTFWFLATFSAWRDSDQVLKKTEGTLTNRQVQLTNCNADYKIADSQAKFWSQRTGTDQEQINTLQSSLNGNQNAMAACILSLAKSSQPISQKTTLRFSPTNLNSEQHMLTFAAMTNVQVSPVNATFSCEQPFILASASGTAATEVGMMVGRGNATQNTAQFSFSGIPWDRDNPILINIVFIGNLDPWKCRLHLQ
jgi:hypothetical protein